MRTTRSSGKSGLAGKLKKAVGGAVIGAAALLSPYATSDAKADTIQVVNQVDSESVYAPYFSAFSGVIDSNHPGTSAGYDAGIDHELDTSNSLTDWNTVAYSNLDGHKVDYNFADEPHVGDSYTIFLGVKNREGSAIPNFYNMPIQIGVVDFDITNSNGVTGYDFDLSVDTNGDGAYDFFSSGDDLSQLTNEKVVLSYVPNDFERVYGELNITATGVPEPSTGVLLVGAGLAGAGLAMSRRKRK